MILEEETLHKNKNIYRTLYINHITKSNQSLFLRLIKALTIDYQLVRVFYLLNIPTLSPQSLYFEHKKTTILQVVLEISIYVLSWNNDTQNSSLWKTPKKAAM